MSESGSTDTSGKNEREPLFSVVWCGCDRLNWARETVAALQAQTCTDFELVVEDCGSTDGTLEFFEAAAAEDSRIRIFNGWTKRSSGALLSALRQCRGIYVSICPCDGHLLPEALDTAARQLSQHPDAGGVCTAEFLIDAHGGTLETVDIVTLLLTPYWPFLPAAFFRRSALLAVGISREEWFSESFPLELCLRLATDVGLVACSLRLVSCANPKKQNDGLLRDVKAAIDDRLNLVAKTFSQYGFFGRDQEMLALESKANQLSILWQQFRALGQSEIEYLVQPPLLTVAWSLSILLRMDHRVLRTLHRLLCVRGHNLGLLNAPLQKILSAATRMEGRLPIHVGYTVWGPYVHGPWLTRKIVQLTLPGPRFHQAAPSRAEMYADLYALAGARYESRGQIDLALEMWERARPPDDIGLDSLGCQAMLKSPAATDESLAAHQAAWVRRHLGERPIVTLPRRPNSTGKIRIAYFCAFMNSDTIRNMMRSVFRAHDRTKFEIFGYAPLPVPKDIESAFDVCRYAPSNHTQEQFADLIRSDGIDVFVELTGFSPGNRFAAMSLRCAPIQVSYLNHTGTSQVPNVDYVLSDEICVPPNSDAQRHYSERIYRLPGCFFCFDYSTLEEPPVAPPPHLKNGFITFGCFGSGGKFSNALIQAWATLLNRVPESILHLQNAQLSTPEDRRFMLDRFRALDIPAKRLALEGGVDRRTLLKIYSRIDISLDTWPYCGGNTIAESLWHGVPVITCRGGRFSSAYGTSLVTAAGCTDLIGETLEDYVEIGRRLANDSARLVYLRNTLRQASVTHGLGDSTRHARRLEHAYLDMLNQTGEAKYN